MNQSTKIIKEGTANLQKNIETVGGKLTLTPTSLIFSASTFNLQRGTTEIQLSDIDTIEKGWTKFLGIVPLIPNSISISTSNGLFKFVIYNRNKWIQVINQARSSGEQ